MHDGPRLSTLELDGSLVARLYQQHALFIMTYVRRHVPSRDAPILILDEPTAALDVEAEAEVMRALDQLVVNRTVIVISHRLSTLGNVDEILVLKQGLIAERGSYKELKQLGGIFAHLLAEQNRFSSEGAGDKSILRSAFQEVPAPQALGQPAATPVPVGVMTPPARGGNGNGNQRGWQPQPQIPQGPLQEARVLIELDGKVVGERRLDKPLITVGRLQGNDVCVPNQRVSRLHARIRYENNAWIIEDADSVNGIVYQGTRVERLALNNGDKVYIAPAAMLRYQIRQATLKISCHCPAWHNGSLFNLGSRLDLPCAGAKSGKQVP